MQPVARATSQALQLAAEGDERYLGAGPPMVPDPVRPRLAAVDGQDAAAARDGSLRWERCRRSPGWQAAGVDLVTRGEAPGKVLHEVGAWVSPGLCSDRCRCPPSTSEPSTPPPVDPSCCSRRGGGACPPTRSGRCCRTCAARWPGCTGPRRPGRRRLPPVRRRPATGWPTRAGRTPRTRFSGRDGRIAAAPIALCEVQAYAYAAAAGGRVAGGVRRAGVDEWREWAAGSGRFRSAFWVDGYPGRSRSTARSDPVAGRTSNMGHLLGTGLLDADGGAGRRRRPGGAGSRQRLGLRTMSTADPVQPARLPRRQRLAARHRDGDRRACPRPVRPRRGVGVGRGAAPRRGSVRLPAARAVRRHAESGGGDADAVPAVVPPSGMGGRLGHRGRGRRTRGRTRRSGRNPRTQPGRVDALGVPESRPACGWAGTTCCRSSGQGGELTVLEAPKNLQH